jgi:ABC-type transport system involved in cytochrome bd biosynthesis fused ATPase/permease subunit
MMTNKRLLHQMGGSKKYIAAHVALQEIALAANIAVMFTLAGFLQGLVSGQGGGYGLLAAVGAAALVLRFGALAASGTVSYRCAKTVKGTLRRQIYEKLLRLGAAYRQEVVTSEVVQVAVEGVDQLDTYFGAYLPRLFYSLLAPITLFAVLAAVNLPSALILLVCVPLIPAAIIAVQRFAKKLLAKYWGKYTAMGDVFLENLEGMTTLKIYRADGARHEAMNKEAEAFRRITMKVLTMQLNSITVMDIVAYGGAALGMAAALLAFRDGRVDLGGCLTIILLSAEFFIPMRRLGSFFHVAMNGAAAADKIFRLLDLPEPPRGSRRVSGGGALACRGLGFCYEPGRPVLEGVDLTIGQGAFVALAGESGCGKSTLAGILAGRLRGYQGSAAFQGEELSGILEDDRMRTVTYVGHNSYLFKGTVEENLRPANPGASEKQLREVLERAGLARELGRRRGLKTLLTEGGANLSGGQRQRLALARALLHDSPVYVFDEVTSSVDADTERHMMEQIRKLAGEKTVIVISHRLANLMDAEMIYVMDRGRVVQRGSHRQLAEAQGTYRRLWESQQTLEALYKEEKP